MVKTHLAYVSVGSNLGDKLENCRRAIAELKAIAEIRITGQSRFYQTEPVDFTAQGWFVNGAVRMETGLSPVELLDQLLMIQRKAGRPPDGPRFGPRVLDLDLLMYDDWVLEEPRLTLPHPRMHQRRFVLQPMCDIDPYIVHPTIGKDIQKLLSELSEHGQQVMELR